VVRPSRRYRIADSASHPRTRVAGQADGADSANRADRHPSRSIRLLEMTAASGAIRADSRWKIPVLPMPEGTSRPRAVAGRDSESPLADSVSSRHSRLRHSSPRRARNSAVTRGADLYEWLRRSCGSVRASRGTSRRRAMTAPGTALLSGIADRAAASVHPAVSAEAAGGIVRRACSRVRPAASEAGVAAVALAIMAAEDLGTAEEAVGRLPEEAAETAVIDRAPLVLIVSSQLARSRSAGAGPFFRCSVKLT
jgi:hypothetical protein